MATVNEYKSADRLIAAAEVRRDRTLREIERRREHLARRVREASDKIIDDEAAEVARAAA
jgi:DNA transposition AAA+ family ATPase